MLPIDRGGHLAELLRMRPHDRRYNAIPLPEAPKLDATVAYVAMRSPISDPYVRFQQAEKMKREGMIKNSTTFFKPWETIFESNPQRILERKERGASTSGWPGRGRRPTRRERW